MNAKKLILGGVILFSLSVNAQKNPHKQGEMQRKEMHEQQKFHQKQQHTSDKLADKNRKAADKLEDKQLNEQRELQKKQLHNNNEALKRQEQQADKQEKLGAKHRRHPMRKNDKRYPPIKYGRIAANNPPVPTNK